MRVKPLYLRREEAFERKMAREEEARQAELMKKREKFKPVDFLSPDVELPETAYDRPAGAERSHQAARPRKHVDATVPVLPPIKQYYRGAAREKVLQEMRAQRGGKQIAVREALERKSKALQYSKLVAELHVEVPPEHPTPTPATNPVSRRAPSDAANHRSASAAGEPPSRRPAPSGARTGGGGAGGGGGGGAKRPGGVGIAEASYMMCHIRIASHNNYE